MSTIRTDLTEQGTTITLDHSAAEEFVSYLEYLDNTLPQTLLVQLQRANLVNGITISTVVSD